MVSNNLCQKAVWNYQDDEEITEFIDNKGLYIADTGFHDVFRKYDYPNDILFSLDESLEYINSCDVFEDTVGRLKEFWSKYPNGMINFG